MDVHHIKKNQQKTWNTQQTREGKSSCTANVNNSRRKNEVRKAKCNETNVVKCYRCGRQHAPSRAVCPDIGKACNKCHKVGHFALVCRIKEKKVQVVRMSDNEELECKSDETQHFITIL